MGKTGNLMNNELSVGGMILGFSWVKEVSFSMFSLCIELFDGCLEPWEFMALEKSVT